MSVQIVVRTLACAGVLALVAACSPATRGVGSQPASVTLTLATAFQGNTEAQPFVDAVSRLSGGSMQIAFKGKVHAGEDAIEESLLDDVAAGTYDMTWTAQRPWPARGNKAFDALVAPFLIDSYDLERAVLEDAIAQQMIASVHGSGLVGIGVVPGPLRVIASHRPVVKPSDLANAVVGIDDTWVGDETVKALGGTTAIPSDTNLDSLDTLTGAVAQLGAIAGNRWFTKLPSVSAGIPFWPRPVIVVMNQARYEQLTDDQRRWLHDGVTTSIARRAEQLESEDQRAIESICTSGTIPYASADDQAAFRTAAAPVYEQLNLDPATSAFIQRIDALKATAPAVTPPACDETLASGSPGNVLGIPDGTYRVSVTSEDVEAWLHANNVPSDADIPFRPENCPCALSFTLQGTDLVTDDGDPWKVSYFGGDHISIGDNEGTYGFRWSFADDTLTLSDITGGAWGDAQAWTIKPFVRDR